MAFCNQTEMFRFKTAQFVVRAAIFPDDDIDTSFDETGETQANLESGLWQAFGTIVTVETNDGIELSSDVLCGSIYANPRDFFKEHIGLAAKSRVDGVSYGCYFPEMVREAIREARNACARIALARIRI